jgi:hypothetical protein
MLGCGRECKHFLAHSLSSHRVDPLILESFNPSRQFGTAMKLLARIKGSKD